MRVVIHNLYGIKDGRKAYYRKQGDGCFDFCNDAKYASDLTKEECDGILRNKEWYCKQYGATDMTVE